MVSQIFAIVIFVLMFALIIMDKIPRHWVTLGCGLATIVIVFAICMKSPSAIMETLNVKSIFTLEFWHTSGQGNESSSGINWATIIFIAGMMVMVEGMAKAGFFRWLCLTIAKAVKYKVMPWARNTNIRQKILKKGFLNHGEEYLQNAYKNTLKGISYLESDDKLNRRMREMFILNLNWFMQTLLARKDNMSMASSLEVRVPFCDYRLVEYAYNMPWDIKALAGREKGILRKAFENDLPNEIAWRKKSPYPKTHNPVYFARVKELLTTALTDSSTPIKDWIDTDNLYQLMQNPDSLPEPWYGQLMGIPQIAAYIYQIYVWIKNYNVEFEI